MWPATIESGPQRHAASGKRVGRQQTRRLAVDNDPNGLSAWQTGYAGWQAIGTDNWKHGLLAWDGRAALPMCRCSRKGARTSQGSPCRQGNLRPWSTAC